jgi:hypothetical protein
MLGRDRVKLGDKGLWLVGVFSLLLCSPSYAQTRSEMPDGAVAPANAESQCYAQAISYGATPLAQQRAAYLCKGATSIAPAQCYWNALSYGATDGVKQRAARLCRGANSTAPAQCYWNTLGFGSSRFSQQQAVRDCMTQPAVTLPIEVQDCVDATRYQLQVSPSSALNACVAEYYRH